MGENVYIQGTCNTIDDESGRKVKMSEVRKRWDGAYVTVENWEERQPQDFPVIPSPSRVFQNSRGVPPVKVYTDPDKSTLGG